MLICPHAPVLPVYAHESFSHVSLPNSPGLRDRVEDPQALAGAHVEAADVTLHVRLAGRHATRAMRGADDDDVAGDRRRGMQPDLARHRIDLLIVVLLQVDDAVVAEPRDAHAGLRVQRDELIAGRDVEDALLFAVGPVREAAARELARRRAPRGPSRSLCIHSSSPVSGSSATTARRLPAVEYSTPLAITGVDSNMNSGRGPR